MPQPAGASFAVCREQGDRRTPTHPTVGSLPQAVGEPAVHCVHHDGANQHERRVRRGALEYGAVQCAQGPTALGGGGERTGTTGQGVHLGKTAIGMVPETKDGYQGKHLCYTKVRVHRAVAATVGKAFQVAAPSSS